MTNFTTPPSPPRTALGVLQKITSNYLLRRLAKALFTIWLVASITFFVIRAMPGNAVEILIQDLTLQGVSPEDAQNQAAAMMGIDLNPVGRLDEAAGRVLAAKERFGLLAPGGRGQGSGDRSQGTGVREEVGTAEQRALAREVAGQAITLLRDDARRLPVAPGVKLLVIEPPAGAGLGQALSATTFAVSANPSAAEIRTAVGLAADGRTVIVATADARQNPGQARLVQELLAAGAPVIVIAVRGPYDLMAFPTAPTCLASYGANPPALDALAAVLFGRAKPAGRLPVELPGLYPLGAGLGDFVEN